MKRQFGLDEITRDDRSVLTVGTFDGVHRGHQAILAYLRERAAKVDGQSVVVSFDPHPREVVLGEQVPLLTTLDERADLLESFGIDRFVVLPFTRDLSNLEPDPYVEDILIETVGLREAVIGYDHRFGRNRAGSRETLEALGARHGFSVDVIPEQLVHEATVSSSRIRKLLADAGDVATAADLLGRPYALTGTVVRGRARGRTIGYPTANLRVRGKRKLVPKLGVYAVRVETGGQTYGGMMNVGRRPTFEADGAVSVEVYLFDFAGDLYGDTLDVTSAARIRDEAKFDGPESLVAQLQEDEQRSRAMLG
ncbi:MAG: bifunctional riboflavin kinase/FAD synthetase [Bacteroidota bacterium]